jgi:hypothetical protein
MFSVCRVLERLVVEKTKALYSKDEVNGGVCEKIIGVLSPTVKLARRMLRRHFPGSLQG